MMIHCIPFFYILFLDRIGYIWFKHDTPCVIKKIRYPFKSKNKNKPNQISGLLDVCS